MIKKVEKWGKLKSVYYDSLGRSYGYLWFVWQIENALGLFLSLLAFIAEKNEQNNAQINAIKSSHIYTIQNKCRPFLDHQIN